MESSSPRLPFDLTSRMLSIVGVVVAIGTAAYVYTQSHAAGTRAELVQAFDQQLGDLRQQHTAAQTKLDEQFKASLDRQDTRMENWNSQLNGALASFRQDASELLVQIEDRERTANLERQVAFQQAIDDLPAKLAAAAPAADGSAASEKPTGLETAGLTPPANAVASDETAAGETAGDEANAARSAAKLTEMATAHGLRVVTTVLRPGTGNTTLIEVANEGDQEAEIDRIRFRPESEFQNSDKLELDPDVASTSSITTIIYDSSDNTSKKPGYHGIYDRQLQNAIRIPAGERVTLRVMIQDPDHVGWGFTGKLVLSSRAQDTLTVESARIVFADPS